MTTPIEVTFPEPPPSGVGQLLALAALTEQGDEAARQQVLEFMASPAASAMPRSVRDQVQNALDTKQARATNRRRRRNDGKCLRPSCPNIPEPNRSRCKECIEKKREEELKSKRAKRARGECEDCGSPRMNRNKMVCMDCYDKRQLRRVFLKKDMHEAIITRLHQEPDFVDVSLGLHGEVMAAMVTGATVGQAINAGAKPRHFARAVVKGIIYITMPDGLRWEPTRPELWRKDPERFRDRWKSNDEV